MDCNSITSSENLSMLPYTPKDQEKPCPFNDIPTEIALKIFSSLDIPSFFNLNRMCRNFHWILDESPSLFCTQDISSKEVFNPKVMLATIAVKPSLDKLRKQILGLSEKKKKKNFEEMKNTIEKKFEIQLNNLVYDDFILPSHYESYLLPSNEIVLAAKKHSFFAVKLLLKLKDSHGISSFTESEVNQAFLEVLNSENLDFNLMMLLFRDKRTHPSVKALALLRLFNNPLNVELIKEILTSPQLDFSLWRFFSDSGISQKIIQLNNLEIFEVFLASPSYPFSNNNHLFELVSEYCNLEMVKVLYADTKREISSSCEHQALINVIKYRVNDQSSLELFKYLLARQRMNLQEYKYAILKTCKYGNVTMLLDLLSLDGLDPTPLMPNIFQSLKIDSRRLDIVEILLSYPNVDPSANNNAALRIFCAAEQVSIVSALLKDPRVDPSVNDNEAIYYAIECSRNLDMVKILLEHPNFDKFKLGLVLQLATLKGDVDYVKKLINDPRLKKYGNRYDHAIKLSEKKAKQQNSFENRYKEISELLKKNKVSRIDRIKNGLSKKN